MFTIYTFVDGIFTLEMFVIFTLVKTFNRKDLGAELDNTIYFTATNEL